MKIHLRKKTKTNNNNKKKQQQQNNACESLINHVWVGQLQTLWKNFACDYHFGE